MIRAIGIGVVGALIALSACASVLGVDHDYHEASDGGVIVTPNDAAKPSIDGAASGMVDAGPPPPGFYTVGGSISGLAGGNVVLAENGGNAITVSANGSFTFSNSSAYLLAGASYIVTIESQPSYPFPPCTVMNASGTIGDASVTDVQVVCGFSQCNSTVTPITTCADLATIPMNPRGTFALQGDVDCSETMAPDAGFVPLQNFEGCLFGNGHAIDKLTIKASNQQAAGGIYAGLFENVSNATIFDLGLTNVDITSGQIYAGTLAAEVSASTIARCYATGTIALTSGGDFVGGLISEVSGGQGASTTIEDCYTDVTISTGGSLTGGLVGEASGGVTIARSYATGNVTTSMGTRAGSGLVGENSSAIIVDSFSTSAAQYGLCSFSQPDATTDSFFAGDAGTSGQCGVYEDAGPGYFQGTGISTKPPFDKWDFVNVWQEVAGGYPTLRAPK